MDDVTRLESLQAALSQPERGLYFVPIRHHSPACAWAVRQLIREVKPKQVLIEAPSDLQRHIPLLLDDQTQPPVALAVLISAESFEQKKTAQRQAKLAAYYPFCAHSPEYVALVEGQAIKASLQFIDLPSADKAMLVGETEDAGSNTLLGDDEAYFDSGDFIEALCEQTGCRNGFELWDHLFESRLGTADWQAFLADLGAYCSALRDSTPHKTIEANGDLAREQFMSNAILAALQGDGPIVVITGGFHSPALIEAMKQAGEQGSKLQKNHPSGSAESYLIRYSFKALDALNGYGAGLPQPGYYDYLWQKTLTSEGELHWRETALELLSQFNQSLQGSDHRISVPAQVEALRLADGLAAMRGRVGAGRYDLIDAVRTAVVKGEIGTREIWTEKLLEFLRGNAIGNVPASAGSPPIVEDARATATRLRIDVSDGSRRQRQLDIRRKPAHLAASRFFHAMTLAESSFAERQSGPDFINGINTGRLFEEWSYAWSPTVEGKLIELATLGDTINSACAGLLERRMAEMKAAGHSQDIAALAELFVHGVLAGLYAALAPLLEQLASDLQSHGDFSAVAETLRRLHHIANASGPLQISRELPLDEVRQAAFQRLIYLCDDLPKTPEEAIQDRIEALRLMMELLRAPGAELFDRAQFDAAINRVAEAQPPAEILGAVLAIAVHAGLRQPQDIVVALAGSLAGTADEEKDRIGVLRGLLFTTPEILWRDTTVLEETDRLLCGLSEDSFFELLPHIRLAFTALNPREADRVAGALASLYGGQAVAFMDRQTTLSESDLEQGVALERALKASLVDDQLHSWLSNANSAPATGEASE